MTGRKLGLKATIWNKRKKNKHPSRTKGRKRIQKSEESLTNLWDNLKHSNIRIIGVPEGEEEEQKIENLFEQIMKKNFSNLAKGIDFQEAQRVPKKLDPKKLDPKRNTPSRIIIKLPEIKYKWRILKEARGKESHLQMSSRKTIS